MKPRTVGPPSGQQHEPWMAEKREDRADPVGALDSIAEMEGHMVDEVETRTGLLDSYSAPDLALAIEPAAAVKAAAGALRGRADGERRQEPARLRRGHALENHVDGVKGLVGLLREPF